MSKHLKAGCKGGPSTRVGDDDDDDEEVKEPIVIPKQRERAVYDYTER